ncbi:MAG: Type 1 glutamine amidotransferase-like domain-containing protein [Microgenomates group bacterium]
MKTTYILHGGFTPYTVQINDLFFAEISMRSPENPTILMVYFATDNGDKYFAEDSEQFIKNSHGQKLTLIKATEEDFENQVINADVVYLRGGRSGKLLEALKRFPNFSQLVKGKVIAGDSAGAKVLCKAFHTSSHECVSGLGLLPNTLICHYKDSDKETLKDLESEQDAIYLREYEYKVISLEE